MMVTLFVLCVICIFIILFTWMIARQYHRLFRIVYDSVSRVIVFLNTDYNILSINEKGAILLNRSVKDLIGQPFTDLFPPSLGPIVTTLLQKKLKSNSLLSKTEIDYYNESKTVCWTYFNLLKWRQELVFLSRDPFLKEHNTIQRMQHINRNYQEFVFKSFTKFEVLHDFVWNFIYEFQSFFQSKRVLIIETTSARILYDTDECGIPFPRNFVDYLMSISNHGVGVVTNAHTASSIDQRLTVMGVGYQLSYRIRPEWLFVSQKTSEFSKNFYVQQWDELERHIFFQLAYLFQSELSNYRGES